MLGESGYARTVRDAYFTPQWCTEALLRVTDPLTFVCDPACGDGAICKVLIAHGLIPKAADIHDYGYPGTEIRDFFSWMRSTADIVTNPPYSCAVEFVEHALKITELDRRRVIMLLRNEWDSASSRTHLFQHPAFKAKWVLTKRPKWVSEIKASPRHNFAWFEWDWRKAPEQPAQIGWMQ